MNSASTSLPLTRPSHLWPPTPLLRPTHPFSSPSNLQSKNGQGAMWANILAKGRRTIEGICWHTITRTRWHCSRPSHTHHAKEARPCSGLLTKKKACALHKKYLPSPRLSPAAFHDHLQHRAPLILPRTHFPFHFSSLFSPVISPSLSLPPTRIRHKIGVFSPQTRRYTRLICRCKWRQVCCGRRKKMEEKSPCPFDLASLSHFPPFLNFVKTDYLSLGPWVIHWHPDWFKGI